MWTYNNPNDLYHSGVIGMHWGKRTSSSDHSSANKLKKKKIHEMSNNELKELTNRLTLEKNYKSLNPHMIKKGAIIVGTVGGTIGSILAIKNGAPQIMKMGKDLVEGFRKAPNTISKVGPTISKISKTPFFYK